MLKPEQALRFVVPDLESAPQRTGLRIAPTGGLDTVDGDASVRQAIILLLRTRPGERVMRPDYGCDLHRLVFSPNDDTTAGLAMHYVREAIERWEPRVQIDLLDAGADESRPEVLNIFLQYKVTATQGIESLNLPVNLAGESA
jgi:phage baseplate assembly protein W